MEEITFIPQLDIVLAINQPKLNQDQVFPSKGELLMLRMKKSGPSDPVVVLPLESFSGPNLDSSLDEEQVLSEAQLNLISKRPADRVKRVRYAIKGDCFLMGVLSSQYELLIIFDKLNEWAKPEPENSERLGFMKRGTYAWINTRQNGPTSATSSQILAFDVIISDEPQRSDNLVAYVFVLISGYTLVSYRVEMSLQEISSEPKPRKTTTFRFKPPMVVKGICQTFEDKKMFQHGNIFDELLNNKLIKPTTPSNFYILNCKTGVKTASDPSSTDDRRAQSAEPSVQINILTIKATESATNSISLTRCLSYLHPSQNSLPTLESRTLNTPTDEQVQIDDETQEIYQINLAKLERIQLATRKKDGSK